MHVAALIVHRIEQPCFATNLGLIASEALQTISNSEDASSGSSKDMQGTQLQAQCQQACAQSGLPDMYPDAASRYTTSSTLTVLSKSKLEGLEEF